MTMSSPGTFPKFAMPETDGQARDEDEQDEQQEAPLFSPQESQHAQA